MLFRDFHPKHEKIDYVVAQIGNSYFNQIPDTHDRDLQSAVEAIKYYKELKKMYPGSKYAAEVTPKVRKAEKMLREKQKYIADFYFKTEVFDAARWRYLDILENFGNKKLRMHSMARVVESSYHMNDYKACVDYTERFWDRLEKSQKNNLNSIIKECKSKAKR